MSVGYKLSLYLRDFAPADWTSGELVVALMIADDASDSTRQSWLALPELCFRARLKESSVRAALRKLAARGFEFRVAHGTGKDGRPVFAARGHAVDYIVPDILKAASALAPLPVDNPLEGVTALAPLGDGKALAGERKALAQSPKGATALAPLSSDLLSTPHQPSSVADTAAEVGATLPTGQVRSVPDDLRPSKLERAAWQAAQSPTSRLAAQPRQAIPRAHE